MKFNTVKLEKLLKKTGLPYHSMPFIHGGLTALTIAPDFIDMEIEIGAPLLVLFDTDPEQFPEQGIDDPLFDDLMEYLDDIDMSIIDDVEGECYSSYLGDKGETNDNLAMVKEWCRGFMSVVMIVGVVPEEDDDNANAAFVFAAVLLLSGLAPDRSRDKEGAIIPDGCQKNPDKFLSNCVYEANIFWGEKEFEYENEEMFPNDDFHNPEFGTAVRSVPKIQRNDPCPCGSGKKYKKCCGKDGDSHEVELPDNFPGKRPNNIIEFPGTRL